MVRWHDEAELPHGRELPLHGELQNPNSSNGIISAARARAQAPEAEQRAQASGGVAVRCVRTAREGSQVPMMGSEP